MRKAQRHNREWDGADRIRRLKPQPPPRLSAESGFSQATVFVKRREGENLHRPASQETGLAWNRNNRRRV